MQVSGKIDVRELTAFLAKLQGIEVAFQSAVCVGIMRAVSARLKEEAKRRCPVEDGWLEGDIRYRVRPNANANGATGSVFIDSTGKSAPYAMYIHEDDDYKIGKLSQEKQSREGVIVGRKFLERAIADTQEELMAMIAAGVMAGLAKYGGRT